MAGPGRRLQTGTQPPRQQTPANVQPVQAQHTGTATTAGFDGAADTETSSKPNPFAPGLGYDPAKPAHQPEKKLPNRLELPPEAYRDSGKNVSYPVSRQQCLPRRNI